jgi:hypothetical protein
VRIGRAAFSDCAVCQQCVAAYAAKLLKLLGAPILAIIGQDIG